MTATVDGTSGITAPLAVIIAGATSGQATISPPAVAGTPTLTLPTASDTLVGRATTDTLTNKTISGASNTITGVGQPTLTTSQACSSGTSVNIGSIPAGTKEIDIFVNLISTTGTANPLLQLGKSSGIESAGYTGSGSTNGTTHANNSTGFFLSGTTAAATNITGHYMLRKIDSANNAWSLSGGSNRADGNTNAAYGLKTLSAELTQFTLSTTDAFDGAGTFYYTYR